MEQSMDVEHLERMIEDLRRMRYRLCEPKNNGNRRYHAFSAAISFLLKATDDLRTEDAG
jgi:hypothetical protein